MIYIDPPYNTGKDFVYRDNFAMSKDDYDLEAGNVDELGNRFRINTDSNARFHSDWCSMIYERLMIARSLLTDDGVIFISIDDNEVNNLKLICDEVFGSDNFINTIAVKMSEPTGVKMSHQWRRFPKLKEYILFYKKGGFNKFVTIDKYRISQWDHENNIFIEGLSKEDREELIELEEKGQNDGNDVTKANNILKKAKKKSLAKVIKDLSIPDAKKEEWLFDNCYRIIKTAGASSLKNVVTKLDVIPEQDIAASLSPEGVLFFYVTDFNRNTSDPRLRVIFADSNIYKNPCDFWQDIKTSGAVAMEGGVLYKNGKKPLQLLNRIVKMTTKNDDIVLDFFSGSSSTAHSVMQMNLELEGSRKFIMVQLPENLDETVKEVTGDTKKDITNIIKFLDSINKPHYLTELGKERIRRAGKKIKAGSPLMTQNLDTGFRVFKLDESNMEDVYFAPSTLTQGQIAGLIDNVKQDRNDLDLLFGCMLDWGVQLSLPLAKKQVDGKTIHIVNDGDLVACFDDGINEEVINAIAALEPLRVVFRDSGFESAPLKINLFEMFKQRCGWSEENVADRVRII